MATRDSEAPRRAALRPQLTRGAAVLAAVGLALCASRGWGFTPIPTNDASELTAVVLGPGVSVTMRNAFSARSDSHQLGVVYDVDEPILPFTNGIMLTSGIVEESHASSNLITYDEGEVHVTGVDLHGDDDLEAMFGMLTADAAGLELTVVPSNSTLNLRYVMASEYYFLWRMAGEDYYWNPPGYSDADIRRDGIGVFAILLGDGAVPGVHTNIALTPDGSHVGIRTVNQFTNENSFVRNVETNAAGEIALPSSRIKMRYNGATHNLVATAKVVPGRPYSLRVVVADAKPNRTDIGRYDIALFLEKESLSSGTDLAIDVEAIPEVVPQVGGTGRFRVRVTNRGPVPAENAVVTNWFPAGVVQTGVTLSRGSVTSNGLVRTWQLGTLTNGHSATMNFDCTFPLQGLFTNRAEVSTSTGDYVPTNNADEAVVQVGAGPDLRVTKTGDATAVRGDNASYTVSVANTGFGVATNVVYRDLLPDGVSPVGPAVTNANLGDLAPGWSTSFAYTVAVPAGLLGPLTNTAWVTSDTPDSLPGNETGTWVTALVGTDLRVTKTGDPMAWRGGSLSYTVTVVNAGVGIAEDVVYHDLLPDGILPVQPSVTNASLGDLAPGASTSLAFTVTVATNALGPLTNTAWVTGSSPEVLPGNETGTWVTALAGTDLRVDKAGPAVGERGGDLSYTVTVVNAGVGIASNVVYRDFLPEGVMPVGPVVTNASLGDVPSGWSTSFAYTVTVPADALGPLTNIAWVTTDTRDTLPGNETGTCVTALVGTDLRVFKTGDPMAVRGSNLSYTVTITNAGIGEATNVVYRDSLPAGVTPVGQVTTNANLGDVPGGWSTSYTYTVTVATNALGPLTNTAWVESPTPDTLPGNETGTWVTALIGTDLRVTKTGDPVAYFGQELSYTVEVRNLGAGVASNVVYRDLLPDWVTPVGPAVTNANLGDLPDGASTSFHYTVAVATNAIGPLTNTAWVTTPTPDTHPGDELDTWVTPVAPPNETDLRVIKTGPAMAERGGDLSYTVRVVNAGLGTASNLVYYDLLPAGVTPVGPVVTNANLGNVPPGWSTNFYYTVTVATNVLGPLTNIAWVTSPTTDTLPGNNTGICVTALAGTDLRVTKVGPAMAVRGDDLSYTVTVVNAGVGVASNVVYHDRLPAGVTPVGPVVTNANLGEVPSGWSTSFTYTVSIPTNTLGPLTNIAWVTTATPETLPGNETGICVTALEGTDLRVTKTGPPMAERGGDLSYTVTVVNAGVGIASNVVYHDLLPDGVTPTVPAVTNVTLGDMAAGASTSITYMLTIATNALGPLTNIAWVASPTPDTLPGNETGICVTVLHGTDLRVIKTGPAMGVRGGDLSYTVTVVNAGVGIASNVVYRDRLPAGVTPVGPVVTNASLGVVPSGWSTSFAYTVSVPTNALGPLTNIAWVTSPTPDAVPGNETGICVTALAGTDLRVTKTGDSTAERGGNLSYMVTVMNAGVGVATNVVYHDLLPDGVTPVGPVVTNANLGDVPAGWSTSFVYTVTVPTNALGPLTNIAWVTSPTPETLFGNETGTWVTVLEGTDLRVTKAGPALAVRGGNLSYTVTVANAGVGVASNVVYRDLLPPVVMPVGPVVTNANLGDVPSGWSTSFSYTVTVPTSALGPLTNTAWVTSPTPDTQPGNETGTCVTVLEGTDLRVIKTGDPVAVRGGNLSYTVTVSNLGVGAATNVVYRDLLPAGVTPVGGAVTNTNLGTVPSAWSTSFTYTVAVDTNVLGPLTNTAWVTTPTPDTLPGNETGTWVTVLEGTDLRVEKVGPHAAERGGNLSYTVTVVNAGVGIASNVVYRDLLPVGVTPVGPAVTNANLGDVPSGWSTSFTYAVTIATNAPGPLTNIAWAASPTPDTLPGNETGICVTVIDGTDLRVTKTGPAVSERGRDLSYTVTVANVGAGVATNVVYRDLLPVGVTPVGPVVTNANLGDVPSGWSTSFSYTVTVPTNALGPLTNTAWVTSPTPELRMGNNTGTCVTVLVGTDLRVAKTGPAMAERGGNLSYTVTVVNAGVGMATNVVYEDRLPVGVAPVGQVVTNANLGSVPAGWSTSFTYTVTVPANALGPLTNTAWVTTPTPDMMPGNETGMCVTVLEGTDLRVTKTGPAKAVRGGNVSYSVTLVNAGVGVATNVVYEDRLPDGVLPVGSVITNANLGDVQPGWSTSFLYTVTVPTNVPGPLTNTAWVTTPTPDTLPGNETGTCVTVLEGTDLRVTKTGPAVAVRGDSLSYTVTVVNAGVGMATNVVYQDRLPAAVSPTGPVVTNANLGDVPSGWSTSFTYTVTVPTNALGPLTNTAWVTTPTPDTLPGNETGICVTVLVGTDLRVTKTGPAVAVRGSNLSYSVTVANLGVGVATNAVYRDLLPEGVVPVGPVVTNANLGDVPAGWSTSFMYTVTVATNTPGPLTNTAWVETGTPDTHPGNETGTCVTVLEGTDLRVTKTGPAWMVPPGNIAYTVLVENLGVGVATNVLYRDELPMEVTPVGLQPTNVVLGDVLPGWSTSFTYAVTVDTNTLGLITNVAWVETGTPDTHPGDERDECVTHITLGTTGVSIVSMTWDLVWSNGLFIGTLQAESSGQIPIANMNYWFELATNVEWRLWNETGTMPTGKLYKDVTADVLAAVRASPNGNGDEVWDPGEVITLTDFVDVYHRRRVYPGRYVDPYEAFVWGRLFQPIDRNRDFRVEPPEAESALQDWRAGKLSHIELLQIGEYRSYPAYIWDRSLNTWRGLEVDAR